MNEGRFGKTDVPSLTWQEREHVAVTDSFPQKKVWDELPSMRGRRGDRVRIHAGKGVGRLRPVLWNIARESNTETDMQVSAVQEMELRLQNKMDAYVENAHFFVSVSMEAFLSMLKSNSIQLRSISDPESIGRSLGHANSLTYRRERDQMEADLFGCSVSGGTRPIYGFASHRPNGALSWNNRWTHRENPTPMSERYGRVLIKIKPEFARTWGTLTFGDSFNQSDRIVPTPIGAPHFSAFPADVLRNGEMGLLTNESKNDIGDITWRGEYAEIQLHAPVTLDAISEIRVQNFAGRYRERIVQARMETQATNQTLEVLYAMRDFKKENPSIDMPPVILGDE